MIRIIKTPIQYESALKRIDEIFDAQNNTPLWDELELLSLLVESYEREYYPIVSDDPIAVIKQRMQDLHLKNKDIAPAVWWASRVSEILYGKRALTVSMIKNLSEYLRVPAEVLL